MPERKTNKERILDAALLEFGSYGFQDSSTNRIYPEAGVSKGLIFKLFGSKANLYYEVYVRAVYKMLSGIDNDFHESSNDPIQKIIEITYWKIQYAHEHPLETKVMLEALSNPPKEIQAELYNTLSELRIFSLDMFFKDIDMSNIDPKYTRQDVTHFINLGLQGLTQGLLNKDTTIESIQASKDKTLEFIKIILKGMEK